MRTILHLPPATIAGALAWAFACGPAAPPTDAKITAKVETPAKPPAKAEVSPKEESPPIDALAPAIGAPAPAIALKGTSGASFDLEQARAEGPVLAIFYRGDW